MTSGSERIPFRIDVSRVIDVLAHQIYQTPLALLRENTQNSFDAILVRRYLVGDFAAEISIRIEPDEIEITDNGIGMTPSDLREHYWQAGASSKNTVEARSAGVVGTFGIGAMANFGIATELHVFTESALTGERTRSSAHRETLSATEDCIELQQMDPTGEPGTRVLAIVDPSQAVDVAAAEAYIEDFVSHVDLPVIVNGRLVSNKPLAEAVPPPRGDTSQLVRQSLSKDIDADLEVRIAAGTAAAWVGVSNVRFRGEALRGQVFLSQAGGHLRTFRSGFGLATVGVTSAYLFGGVANLAALQPTAGREALTTESMQLLQDLVTGVDAAVSTHVAGLPESDLNSQFMEWVRRHRRYDLCDNLRARVDPDNQRIPLYVLRDRSTTKPLLVYAGADPALISAVGTDDSPLVVLAAQNPRRQCEQQYLEQFCRVEKVEDHPTVVSESPPSGWTTDEHAIVFRISSILETDYFLVTEIGLGSLSHGLPVVVITDGPPVHLVFDPTSPTFQVVKELYKTDYSAFNSVAKDFVRNVVFPRVADLVPSSTRQGAEAFLRTIRRTRDVFEYEEGDRDDLTLIWERYQTGAITLEEAARRSTEYVARAVQVVDVANTQTIRDVIPDVVENEGALGGVEGPPDFGAAPPILRTDVLSAAKLLTIDAGDAPVRGYRCFLAISDRAREEKGEFFLQPHSTSVVWGGQKVLFVFEHHSGEFGLYYDLQAESVVADTSGGGPFPTGTIVLHDRTLIPIPDAIAAAFIPSSGERKRFEVRCDLLYTSAP